MTNRRKLLIALGAIGLTVAVLCCAATIAIVRWAIRPSAEDVVDDYLSARRSHDIAAAQRLSCHRLAMDWLDQISGTFEVVDWDIKDSQTHERSADVQARVTYRVLGFAHSGEVDFTLVKEDDDWRVCGMRTVS